MNLNSLQKGKKKRLLLTLLFLLVLSISGCGTKEETVSTSQQPTKMLQMKTPSHTKSSPHVKLTYPPTATPTPGPNVSVFVNSKVVPIVKTTIGAK